MAELSKPIPIPNEDSKQFWEGCLDNKLLLQKCDSCGHVRFYPRILCTECGSTETTWIQSSGRATVYSHTTIHRAPSPAFKADVPYVLALVTLEEGGRMMTNIVGCKPEDVAIDMPVKVKFEKVSDEISVPKFELAI
jgi:uncharacterized OB-fold protein